MSVPPAPNRLTGGIAMARGAARLFADLFRAQPDDETARSSTAHGTHDAESGRGASRAGIASVARV
jgi:hypothetical protein